MIASYSVFSMELDCETTYKKAKWGVVYSWNPKRVQFARNSMCSGGGISQHSTFPLCFQIKSNYWFVIVLILVILLHLGTSEKLLSYFTFLLWVSFTLSKVYYLKSITGICLMLSWLMSHHYGANWVHVINTCLHRPIVWFLYGWKSQ